MATRDMLRDLVAACAAETDDDKLDRFIAYAVTRLDRTEWGNAYTQAVCYLAGHLYTRGSTAAVGGGGGAVGGVTAESAGGMSRSYGGVSGAQSDAELLTTAAGADFVALRKSHVLGARAVLLPAFYY